MAPRTTLRSTSLSAATRAAILPLFSFVLGTFVPRDYAGLFDVVAPSSTCVCPTTTASIVRGSAAAAAAEAVVAGSESESGTGSSSGSSSSSSFIRRQTATAAAAASAFESTLSTLEGRRSTQNMDNEWHSIDVYVGNKAYFYEEPDGRKALESWAHLTSRQKQQQHGPQSLPPPKMGAWHGQARQDVIVASLLGYPTSGGYYIDLAANEAYADSNTYALDRFWRWNGLCIEANPQYWLALARLRTCHVIGAAVGGGSGGGNGKAATASKEPILFKLNHGNGGIVNDAFDNMMVEKDGNDEADAGSYQHFFPIALRELLQRYDVPNVIDYLSLDVEGAESFIMKDFPFDEYDIKILTGERLKRDLRDLLAAQGYTFIGYLSHWGEGLWINAKYQSQLDLSAIPPLYDSYQPHE